MKEVSNSTLTLLVVAAIVVSVFGTMISLNRLNNIGGLGVTGMIASNASPIGFANLTVASSVYLNLTDTSQQIDLGTIDVGQSNDSVVVDDYWHFVNDGTVNISIKAWSDGQSGTYRGNWNGSGAFTAQTGDAQSCLNTNPATCFRIRCNKTLSGMDCNSTVWYNLSFADHSSGEYVVDLAPDTNDECWFAINVTVPYNEPAGDKLLTVSFQASNSE
jgi:hypothetical protein